MGVTATATAAPVMVGFAIGWWGFHFALLAFVLFLLSKAKVPGKALVLIGIAATVLRIPGFVRTVAETTEGVD